jgi:hypothetical protein
VSYRELVRTEGKLGGQAVVPGVAGTWKNLTGTRRSGDRSVRSFGTKRSHLDIVCNEEKGG